MSVCEFAQLKARSLERRHHGRGHDRSALAQAEAGRADRIHRMDAGRISAAFQVCHAAGGQRPEGSCAGVGLRPMVVRGTVGRCLAMNTSPQLSEQEITELVDRTVPRHPWAGLGPSLFLWLLIAALGTGMF